MAVDARNRRNVLVGAPDVKASGGITLGPVVTDPKKFPKDVDTDLGTSLQHKPAGYISEDGVTKSVDRSTEKIKDWQGDTILITQSDHAVSLSLTFMEAANADVLKLCVGENNVKVEENGIIAAVENADELPHRSICLNINGGGGSKIRVFAPDIQVTEVGEVNYVRADVIKYQVTLECFGVDNKKLVSLIKRATDPSAPTASEAA